MDRLVFGVAPDGFPVAECELAADETGLLPALTEKAIRAGAERLWMHCAADLTGFGFQPREGYRRFTVAACPAGDPLPVLDVETITSLWPRAFGGQWGHRHVDAAMARTFAASGEAVFVGLREQGEWTGLGRIEPGERLIDGPGFVGRPRTDDAVRRLVLGACAYLGAGPATAETWGEPAAPYLALGFELAEESKGWELLLDPA